MAVRGVGIDEGSATLKVVQVEKRSGALVPVQAVALAVEDGAWDPVALGAALKAAGIKERQVLAGLTGKDLVIRYHQVPSVPDWQLRKIMEFEIQEIEKQSGDTLASDFNLLPVASDLSSDDTVLLALTREQRVEERTARLSQAGLKARWFVPNAVALYHAFRLYGPAVEGDCVLVNIGRTASDLAILRDGDLLYARSVNTGGDVLTEALAQHFNVSTAKAEKLKRELGDLRPREKRHGLTPQQEKVAYALEGAAGRLFQMVTSTIQFAKSQIQLNRLEPARVFVTGGTANMTGIAESLAAGLGVPVERFDPLGEAGVEVQGDAGTADLTVALGLAVMAADPEAYSIEVLSAAARRAREFQQRHVFSVLAVAALVVWLVFAWFRTGAEYEKASQDVARVNVEQRARSSNESRLKGLVAEREVLAERVDQLEKRRAAGQALVRTQALLVQHLPDELWVESVELDFREAAGRAKGGRVRTPVVRVGGRGRSLAERTVDSAYVQFIDALRSDALLAEGELIDTPPASRGGEFRFGLELSFLREPTAADGEEATD